MTGVIDAVRLSGNELRVELRLTGTKIKVLDEQSNAPVAALLRSGALDLSQAGNLASAIPRLRPILGESDGERVVLGCAGRISTDGLACSWICLRRFVRV